MLQKLCERPSFKEMSIRAMEELAMVVRKVFGNWHGGKESFWQLAMVVWKVFGNWQWW
jgi:hypothetical protein